MDDRYYIIDKNVLPKIFEKVVAAKKLLQSGKCKTVNDATAQIGISRAVYYKYKDYISIFTEKNAQKIVTINMLLLDVVGVLSKILQHLSAVGASILTINQNIPIDGVAPVSISITTETMSVDLQEMLSYISEIDGVLRADVVAKE